MEKHLRNAPTYAVIVALVIQVTRVNDFGVRIGAGWLAGVYAVFLATTIYALSYWTGRLKYEVTADPQDKRSHSQQVRMAKIYGRARVNASLWLILFLAIDGSLNFFETMSALPGTATQWEKIGAVVYGVFPTLAAYGLGSLQAVLDKVPAGPSKATLWSKLATNLLARLDTSDKQGLQGDQQANKQDQQANKQDQQALVPSDKQVVQGEQQVDKQAVTDEALLAYWQANPSASDGQVAKHFGRSAQAIQQRRAKLTARGAFYLPVSDNTKVSA